jgi:DNA-binding MarR family transcriptional regulator
LDEIADERLTLGFLLRDTSRLMRRRFAQRARDVRLELTRGESVVLAEIARTEGVNQATLAARLDMEPIALVRLIDRLQDLGLAERRALAGDRRVRTLWLTDAAGPVVTRILAIRAEVRAEALGGLSPEAAAALVESLRAVRSRLLAVTCADTPATADLAGAVT